MPSAASFLHADPKYAASLRAVSFLPVTVVFCRTAGRQPGLATPYERRIIKADHHEGGMQDEKIYSYSRKSEERRQQ